MTVSQLREKLTGKVLEEECFCKHKCEYCNTDFDYCLDEDGIEDQYEIWWCSAIEGCFCPRIMENLK